MERLNAILRDRTYQEFVKRNQELEQSRVSCCHTFEHMLDVARIVYVLMLEDRAFIDWLHSEHIEDANVGRELIYTVALLHDIGRWEEYETGESHALISGRYAEVLMEKHGYTAQEIKLAVVAIQEHRSSCTPTTILSSYIQRADKLSRLCLCCDVQELCSNRDRMETREGLLY